MTAPMPRVSGGPPACRDRPGSSPGCRLPDAVAAPAPWSSPPGNFHGTLVLKPFEPPETVALRSFAAALALRDAFVDLTGLPQGFALKWPNDVLCNGGKIAGILLESQGFKPTPDPVLCIGIGVNLIAAPTPHRSNPAPYRRFPCRRPDCASHPRPFLRPLPPPGRTWEIHLPQEWLRPPAGEKWLTHAARLGEPIAPAPALTAAKACSRGSTRQAT